MPVHIQILFARLDVNGTLSKQDWKEYEKYNEYLSVKYNRAVNVDPASYKCAIEIVQSGDDTHYAQLYGLINENLFKDVETRLKRAEEIDMLSDNQTIDKYAIEYNFTAHNHLYDAMEGYKRVTEMLTKIKVENDFDQEQKKMMYDLECKRVRDENFNYLFDMAVKISKMRPYIKRLIPLNPTHEQKIAFIDEQINYQKRNGLIGHDEMMTEYYKMCEVVRIAKVDQTKMYSDESVEIEGVVFYGLLPGCKPEAVQFIKKSKSKDRPLNISEKEKSKYKTVRPVYVNPFSALSENDKPASVWGSKSLEKFKTLHQHKIPDGTSWTTFWSNDWTSVTSRKNLEYKSKMCKYLTCKDKYCSYAHSYEELQPTECQFGNRCGDPKKCKYIHPMSEPKSMYFRRITNVPVKVETRVETKVETRVETKVETKINNFNTKVIFGKRGWAVIPKPVAVRLDFVDDKFVEDKKTDMTIEKVVVRPEPRKKTMLCKFNKLGMCTASVCTYAHSLKELSSLSCKFDDRCYHSDCTYIHRDETMDEYHKRVYPKEFVKENINKFEHKVEPKPYKPPAQTPNIWKIPKLPSIPLPPLPCLPLPPLPNLPLPPLHLFSVFANHTVSHPTTNFRSKICKFSPCLNSKCTFAHSVDELQPLQCRFGDKCNKRAYCEFIHPEIETKNDYFFRMSGKWNQA